jgi:phosphoribosylglycinamide formyltransferase-1
VHCLPKKIDYNELNNLLLSRNIDFIILAGFMKILPAEFVDQWQGRIVNIHPSLLPAYPGLNSAERSWNENSNMGVTLHHVTAAMDEGPRFLQKTSLVSPQRQELAEAEIFLRRSEQHLLREMVLRYF